MIDPSKATPQAPRALRVGSKGFARAQRATMAGQPAPAAAEDDDEDEDDDEMPPSSEEKPGAALADHEPMRAAAEEACRAAADAYKASKGTDSAAALMHAEAMGDAAGEAHGKAKASSMALRGAALEQAPADPAKPAPPAPAPPAGRVPVISLARAIAATGGTAEGQAKIAETIAFADRMMALFGGASLEEVEGRARAAHQDAKDAAELRAAAAVEAKRAEKRAKDDAETALSRKLSAAVRAQKFARAELFDVSEGIDAEGKSVEVLTPQAWARAMAPTALDAMIAAKQARVGAGTPPIEPDTSPVNISAAVRQYGEARGYSEAQIARLAASMFESGAAAPQEISR